MKPKVTLCGKNYDTVFGDQATCVNRAYASQRHVRDGQYPGDIDQMPIVRQSAHLEQERCVCRKRLGAGLDFQAPEAKHPVTGKKPPSN